MLGEYAQSGVDYSAIEPFKRIMREAGKLTLAFPNRRGVYIREDLLHGHGAVYEYRGNLPHLWCNTQEGLGNKNWIAEWMYQFAPAGASVDSLGRSPAGRIRREEKTLKRTYYDVIAIDTALMAVNDVIAQGAMPVVYTDEVAVGDAEWFKDEARVKDLAEGFVKVCEEVGMALPAGESPALRYLLKPEMPVRAAPSLSGCVTGLIAPPSRLITGEKLTAGDHIIGVTSSGIHANGISLVIKRGLELPDRFTTKLPNGKMLGEEILTPTRSYVALVEALLDTGVAVHAFLPGTGSGVAKLAYDPRPFTYRIREWVKVPMIFQFFREQGVSLEECLCTFNWGIGYYIFVPPAEVERTLAIGRGVGYDLHDLGIVEAGKREVVFEPEGLTLAPPSE